MVIRKKVLGENHPYVADTIIDLAILYNAKGKNTNAKPLFEQAIIIMETSFGRESPLIVPYLKDYGNFLEQINRKREATKMRIRAKAIQDKHKSKSGKEKH